MDVVAHLGLINPQLLPVMEDDNIVDIGAQYTDGSSAQILHYSEHYSLLIPHINNQLSKSS